MSCTKCDNLEKERDKLRTENELLKKLVYEWQYRTGLLSPSVVVMAATSKDPQVVKAEDQTKMPCPGND